MRTVFTSALFNEQRARFTLMVAAVGSSFRDFMTSGFIRSGITPAIPLHGTFYKDLARLELCRSSTCVTVNGSAFFDGENEMEDDVVLSSYRHRIRLLLTRITLNGLVCFGYSIG